MCHWDSSAQYMPENALLRGDVGTAGSCCRTSFLLPGGGLAVWYGVCTAGLEILMWAFSPPSQSCVLDVRLKSILGHPLGDFKAVLSNNVHSFSGQHVPVLHCSLGKEFLPNSTWCNPNLSSFSVKQFCLVWSLSMHVQSYSPSVL